MVRTRFPRLVAGSAFADGLLLPPTIILSLDFCRRCISLKRFFSAGLAFMAPSGKLIFLVRCGLCGFFTVVMSEYTRGRMGLPGSLFGDELSDTVLLRWVLRLSVTKKYKHTIIIVARIPYLLETDFGKLRSTKIKYLLESLQIPEHNSSRALCFYCMVTFSVHLNQWQKSTKTIQSRSMKYIKSHFFTYGGRG